MCQIGTGDGNSSKTNPLMYHFIFFGLMSLLARPIQASPVPDTLRIYVDSPNIIRFQGKPTLISQYSTDSTIDRRLAAYLKGVYRQSRTLPHYLQIVYKTPGDRALFREGMETAVETALLDVLVYLHGRNVDDASKKFPILGQRKFD
jgi:hypothetical protein